MRRTNTKELILEKSLELFATKGYFNTSMDDISNAVSIKKASLYFHYQGKDDIFLAVFNRMTDEYTSFLDNLMHYDAKAGSFEKLSHIFRSYVLNCKDNKQMVFWDRYYYYPPQNFREYIQERTYYLEMDLMKDIKGTIEAGINKKELKNIDAESVTAAFYNMMIGLAMGVKFYTRERLELEISKCLTMIRAALGDG